MAERDSISAPSEKLVEYRPVPGFPNYRVGDDGSIWSNRGNEWRNKLLTKDRSGYLVTSLSRDGKKYRKSVHRLVLEAFVGPCPKGMEACHFPVRDKDHNVLGNLRWDTPDANRADAQTHGMIGHAFTSEEVREIRTIFAAGGITAKQIARRFNANHATVCLILNGKTWVNAGGPISSNLWLASWSSRNVVVKTGILAGQNNAAAKLTDDNITEIRLAVSSGQSQASLAKRFGISASSVHRIVTGQAWTRIAGPRKINRGCKPRKRSQQ